MSSSILKENEHYSKPTQEIICDTEADIVNLPTEIAAGSTAFVIENSSVYMLNNSKIWVKI